MTSHPCLWKATRHKEKEGGNRPDICCYNWSMWEASSLQPPWAQSGHQGLIQALSSGWMATASAPEESGRDMSLESERKGLEAGGELSGLKQEMAK